MKPVNLETQPVAIVNAIKVTITLAISFGLVHWTDAQVEALLAFIPAVYLFGELAASAVLWFLVYAPDTVRRLRRELEEKRIKEEARTTIGGEG